MLRPAARDHERPALHLSKRVLPFLFVVMAFNFLDRTNVGFAALEMNDDLGFSPQVFGFGAGLLSVGDALFAVPSGVAAQRVGVGRWIAVLILVWGLIATAMGFVNDAATFFVLRFLLGAAEGGVLPCIAAYLSGWIPPERRGRALAIVSAGSASAAVIGGPLGAVLLEMDGMAGMAGWRWLFIAEGAPVVVAGLLAFRWLPPLPTTLASASTGLPQERAGFAELARFIVGHPLLVVTGAINFCIAAGVIASLIWIPLIAAEVPGLSTMNVGWATAAVFSCAAIGMLIVGYLSDRSGLRFTFMTACLLLAAVGYFAAAATAEPIVRLVALSFGVTFLRSSAGDFFVGATERIPPALASSGMAFLTTCAAIGGFLGPVLFGWVKGETGSFSGALVIMAGLLLVATGLGVIVANDFRVARRRQMLMALK